jgi:hypothetical protein
MSDPNARRPRAPLLDALGKLCVEGKQLAEYLWQVPDDAGARQQSSRCSARRRGTKQAARDARTQDHDRGERNTQSAASRSVGKRLRPAVPVVAGRQVGLSTR